MDAFTLTAKLILDSSQLATGLGDAENQLSQSGTGAFSNWGAKVGSIAASAFNTAWRSLSDFGRSAIETGMEFDATMSTVQALSGAEGEAFDMLSDKAQDLGRTTKYTATEVAEGFTYMGQAGWKTEQMLGGIDGVLSLAAASGENLGSVSRLVVTSLNAFGMSANEAGHFADVLAAASTNSATTVGEMGAAFTYVAPIAGSFGMSIEDISIGLGIMADAGIRGTQAGTSLRNILTNLGNPTKAQAKAIDGLGLSLYDTNGRMKSFGTIMTDMRGAAQRFGVDLKADAKAMAELDELLASDSISKDEYSARMQEITKGHEDFYTAVMALGGKRALPALMALMGSTDEEFGKMWDSVYGSEGRAAEMATTMLDNLKGDITILNSAVDGLKILVSNEFREPLRAFIQELTQGIGDISAAFQEGGLVGMFTNLVDWVIDGMTNVLSDDSITVEGATKFGKALGDFVGHLVAKLLTAAPELMSGLFEAGMNLASGLIEGLFSGLFGTGEGSVYGIISKAQDEQQSAIDDANGTANRAQGIVAYMDSLVDKYGEAASSTKEWKDSLAELEKLMPGITTQIAAEGGALKETTAQMRNYIEASRQKGIEDAKRKYYADLIEKYNKAMYELGEAETKREFARNTAQVEFENMAKWAAKWGAQRTGESEDVIYGRYMQMYGTNRTEAYNMLQNPLYHAGMFFDNDADIRASQRRYEAAIRQEQQYDASIQTLTDKAAGLSAEMEIAEEVIRRMSGEADKLTTDGAKEGLANLEASAKALAARMDSVSMPSLNVGGSGDGKGGVNSGYKHATGAWDIPYDNYQATLHRGEMVLTASQARRYREGESGGTDPYVIASAMRSAVMSLTMELNGDNVGRVIGNATTPRVNANLSQINRRKRYGYGG